MPNTNQNLTQTTSKIAKKSSSKILWISGLTVFLIVMIAGSVFYTMNQKMSSSNAASNNQTCIIKGNNQKCVDGNTSGESRKPRSGQNNSQPRRQPIARSSISSVLKPEINPYTGEKQ